MSTHSDWADEDAVPPEALWPSSRPQSAEISISVPYAGAFRWFLAVQASWFFCLGMQLTLFPYLAADVLHISAHRLGLAQAALWAPALLLMLPAGALADHADKRRMLMALQVMAALPALGLGLAVGFGWLTYGALIVYGLAQGTLGAFANPTRDSLLNHVAASSRTSMTVQKAVTAATAAQFTAQLTGMAVALAAAGFGPLAGLDAKSLVDPLLFLQAAVMFAGALWARKLPGEVRAAAGNGAGKRMARAAAAMRDGIREVARSPVMGPVAAGMLAVGILFVGSFMVVLPTLVRDAHEGGLARFALFTLCFWVGTIPSSLFFLRQPSRRPGRSVMLALLWGSLILGLLSLPLPFWAMLLLCIAWGAGAGVSLTLGRAMMQEAAPEAHLGRALAIFNLGFAGGAPIGAVLMGYLVHNVGPHQAAAVPAAAMLLVVGLLGWRSRLWSHRAAQTPA